MALNTMRVVHMSFIVKDIYAVVDKWQALLGLPERPRIWCLPGPDVAPTYTNGELQIYKSTLISVIELENMQLEFMQPTDEDSPWKDWLEKHGEGFVHCAFRVPNEDEARQTIKDVCGVDNFYHIGYYPAESYSFYDTFEALKMELNIKVDKDYTDLIKEVNDKLNA